MAQQGQQHRFFCVWRMQIDWRSSTCALVEVGEVLCVGCTDAGCQGRINVSKHVSTAGIGVGRSRISQLTAEAKKNGKNGKLGGNWGNWGEIGEIGGKWGNVRKCQKYLVGNIEKMCEIRRKSEKNRRKMRQLGTNFPFFRVPFSPLFHSLATFPSGAFGEFCQPNWPTGKIEKFRLANNGGFFG